MIPTSIITAGLVLVVGLIVRKVVKDRKKGGSCGCGCANCPSSGMCHPD